MQHDFNVRNKAALLTEIQRQTRKGGGLSVRTLKESWKEAPQAIEDLEKDGEVYVTRTLKDGQMRMVFWNEVKPTEEQGGMAVEKGVYHPSVMPPRNGGLSRREQSFTTCGTGSRSRTTSTCSRPSRRRVSRRPRPPRLC